MCLRVSACVDIYADNQEIRFSSSGHRTKSCFSYIMNTASREYSIFCLLRKKSVFPMGPSAMMMWPKPFWVQEVGSGYYLLEQEMGKSDCARSYSCHHTVFLQAQRDSDAKPLSPHITRKELWPTAQENFTDPFSSLGFSNHHLSVRDGDRKSCPSGGVLHYGSLGQWRWCWCLEPRPSYPPTVLSWFPGQTPFLNGEFLVKHPLPSEASS